MYMKVFKQKQIANNNLNIKHIHSKHFPNLQKEGSMFTPASSHNKKPLLLSSDFFIINPDRINSCYPI